MRDAVYRVLSARPGGREGRVWPDKNVRKAFETAVAAAKLDDFRFHDLRHSFASSFMMRGGSLAALREILGHATMAMTLRYSHLSPAHLRGEMERTEAPAGPGGADSTTAAQSGRIERERAANA
jgi:integrase